MIIRRLLLSLLLVQLVLSQGGGSGTIQGVIINSYTGLPFPGASVELLGVQHGKVVSRTTRGDAKGEFTFANVPPGAGYQLVVTGDRLLATAYGQNSRNEPWVALTLDPGSDLRNLRINVQPLATIRGRVVDNQGRGMFGARVMALTPSYRSAQRVLQSSATAVTNSRGDYQFATMPAGVYYLRVAPSNSDPAANAWLSTPSQFDRNSQSGINGTANPEGYPVTYFPSTVDVGMAKPINLIAGGDADNTDITINRVKTGRVRGTVTYDGATVMNGQVVLQREGTAVESNWTRFTQIREGQFELRGVLPGAYVLWTRAGEGTSRLWGRTDVDVRGGETGSLAVKVSPAADISGKLTVEGWTYATPPDFTQLAVYLLPDGLLPLDLTLPYNDMLMPSQSITAAADGSFTFRGVPPWNYSVVVKAAAGALPNGSSLRRVYMKSIHNKGSDVADKGLHLGTEFDGSLEITLATDSGGLDGRVLDDDQGANGASAWVVLVPQARHRRDLYLALMASSTGRFQLQGIAPGNYKVFAWKDAVSGSWFDPDFLSGFEDRGLPVQIAPDSAEYVELKRLP